ncbi:diaminopimelate epimerase [Gangjinia marincola]|uniref:Diaminopimelate epimerase n=1 Tax=Gangjinia marincola TaxID=578463 RepID=A0ABN1MEQ6_9FLAO
MQNYTFYKYQGTGNDFIIIDNRSQRFSKNNTKLIRTLCDRKFGIGADGLILLENAEMSSHDFKMVYYNADGRESTMCGNGGRCLVAFAKFLGIIHDQTAFMAIDGPHEARINKDEVSLKMQDVSSIKEEQNAYLLDTGSPHYVSFIQNLEQLDVDQQGAKIRYNDSFNAEGINVNFVEPLTTGELSVRTYERGVEAETLSCGTGVTAVALSAYHAKITNDKKITLTTPGGRLSVSFNPTSTGFTDIWLTGAAVFVFKGEISW